MKKPLARTLATFLIAWGAVVGARAQEMVKLLPAQFELPARLGPLVYGGKPHKFDDPRLGAGYNYQADGARLTIYVYDSGIPDIADGADSMPVCNEFEIAKHGVLQRPELKNSVLESEYLVRLSPPDDAPLVREAVFRIEAEGSRGSSYVWITGAAKHFLKLRFTVVEPHDEEAGEARRAILDAVGKAIRPHLAPVDPNAERPGATLGIAANGASDADMAVSMGYLLVLNEIAEKNTPNMPVCGGAYVPTFEDDLAAYQGALTINAELGGNSKFFKTLAKAQKAGFLEEFVWIELHRDAWGTAAPEGLTLAGYESWRKKNVKKLKVPNFGTVTIDHPRPLPLEPKPSASK